MYLDSQPLRAWLYSYLLATAIDTVVFVYISGTLVFILVTKHLTKYQDMKITKTIPGDW